MLPRTLRIHAHKWKLKQAPARAFREGESGDMQADFNLIRIYNRASATRKIELVLHETLHAMLIGHEFSDEESIVVILGEALTQFVRDNPEFFDHARKVFSRS